ncbi:MAG: aminoacyl-tRNA hydrolase, partial [Angustibacter sp.]
MTSSATWLVVGLGNPGPTYAGHRHNIGAMAADLLATQIGSGWRSHKARALVATGRLAGHSVVVAK